MENNLQQACQQPSKEDIIGILGKIPKWQALTVSKLVAEIMKQYRGMCNPAVIKKIITEIVNDDNEFASRKFPSLVS